MVSTNKKAPADVGASRAGAQLNNQVQDKPIQEVCQMRAKIYRDPPFGILFVGIDTKGYFRIYRKSEATREVRRYQRGYYPFEETAQQALDIMAMDKNLEEVDPL